MTPRRKRAVLAGVIVALLVGGGLTSYVLTRDGDVAPPPPAPPPPAAVVPPAPAAPSPAEPPPRAPAPAPVDPVSIAELAAKSDWVNVLHACAAKPDVGGDERRMCAVAACNTNDRERALAYRTRASRKDLLAIDHACRAKGITLVEPASQR